MHTDTPILHRLGDLPRYAYIELKECCGDDHPATVERHYPDGVGLSDGHILPNDTLVHRLIPETPATKFAGEMLALLYRLINAADRDDCSEVLDAKDLLSRIDAASEGGAA